MTNDASMSDTNKHLVAKIDQLTELVVNRVSALDRRLDGLEGDTAEIRNLLRALVIGIERLNARLPTDQTESLFDMEEADDGFLTPPPGQFLH